MYNNRENAVVNEDTASLFSTSAVGGSSFGDSVFDAVPIVQSSTTSDFPAWTANGSGLAVIEDPNEDQHSLPALSITHKPEKSNSDFNDAFGHASTSMSGIGTNESFPYSTHQYQSASQPFAPSVSSFGLSGTVVSSEKTSPARLLSPRLSISSAVSSPRLSVLEFDIPPTSLLSGTQNGYAAGTSPYTTRYSISQRVSEDLLQLNGASRLPATLPTSEDPHKLLPSSLRKHSLATQKMLDSFRQDMSQTPRTSTVSPARFTPEPSRPRAASVFSQGKLDLLKDMSNEITTALERGIRSQRGLSAFECESLLTKVNVQIKCIDGLSGHAVSANASNVLAGYATPPKSTPANVPAGTVRY